MFNEAVISGNGICNKHESILTVRPLESDLTKPFFLLTLTLTSSINVMMWKIAQQTEK